MSYTGPCEWVDQLSAFCDPALNWKNPSDMHRRCRGTFIAKNPPPSGVGRTYGRCPCKCHVAGKMVSEEELEKWILKENERLDRQ
jgi:hypothetical protein